MAGKPKQLARSAGTDIADSLPPPHAPAHNAGQRRGKQAYRACGEAPTGAPQRRGPGVRVVIGARALALSANKHNECARRIRCRGSRSAIPFRGRSTRRRQSRSAAARSQDAAVYGRCSRPPPGTLMSLSKRQHLPRRGLAGHTAPTRPLDTSSGPTAQNVQVVYFWQARPGSFWIALQLDGVFQRPG